LPLEVGWSLQCITGATIDNPRMIENLISIKSGRIFDQKMGVLGLTGAIFFKLKWPLAGLQGPPVVLEKIFY